MLKDSARRRYHLYIAIKGTFCFYLEKFESCTLHSKLYPYIRKGNKQKSSVSFHFSYFLQHHRKSFQHPNLWKERENNYRSCRSCQRYNPLLFIFYVNNLQMSCSLLYCYLMTLFYTDISP